MKERNMLKIFSLIAISLYLYNPRIGNIGFLLVVLYGLYEIEKLVKKQKCEIKELRKNKVQ